MTATDGSGQKPGAEERFPSLAAMQSTHRELLKSARANPETPGLRAQVLAFLEKGRQTGAVLDTLGERGSAQSLLDYWTATLYTLPRDGGPEKARPPEVSEVQLADFDPLLAPDLKDQPCPYRGLGAFQEADRATFFGREETVQVMLDRLRGRRLLLVVGPSGSGKSSLVLAGLLPVLKAGALPGSRDWQYYPPLVPGTDPLTSLALAVKAGAADPAAWAAEHVPLLRDHPTHLAELVGQAGPQPAFVLVDQFEEVFTLCPDEAARKAFVENLVALTPSAGADHHLVLTLRSDYLEAALKLPVLAGLAEDEQVRVAPPPLTPRELRRVIEGPAQLAGLKFDDGIVDELVKEVQGEPTALPLLQFALWQLWEERARNRITWDVYRRVGGPRQALARTADRVYGSLIPEDQATARRIFLRLVQPALETEYTRKRVRRESLELMEDPARVNRVLDRLASAGLVRVTPGVTRGDDRVEVTHEALIRNWPTLVGWLEAERARLQQRLRLRAAAELWLNSGRDRGALLAGVPLAEALTYQDLEPVEQEFVEASRAEAERAAREEVQKAQALAEANARAARYWRRLVWCTAVLLAMTVVLAIVAFLKAHAARLAKEDADLAAREAKDALTKLIEADQAKEEALRKQQEAEAATVKADERAQRSQEAASLAAQSQRDQLRLGSGLWKYWKPGLVLRVGFLEGSPSTHDKVLRLASQWTEHANLRFVPTDKPGAEIRVAFKQNDGSWSYLGTDALTVPPNQPTMNLGGSDDSFPDKIAPAEVLRMFGHVLGLIDEQHNPTANIPWDIPAVEEYFGKNYHWDKEQIYRGVLEKVQQGPLDHPFDPESIMMPLFPASLTDGKMEFRDNTHLSKVDIAFAKILYPPFPPTRPLPVDNASIDGNIRGFRQSDRWEFSTAHKSKAKFVLQMDQGLSLALLRKGSEETIQNFDARVSEKEHQMTLTLDPGSYLVQISSLELGGEGNYSIRLDLKPE